ncbi:MAG: DMT family transporter [Anaerolineae bacterium]|nr:DMT family transporter [Anaerolineae bacterium]
MTEETAPLALEAAPLPLRAGYRLSRVARQRLADAALLVVTAIWGGTFVMVKDAVAAYPVFSFLAIRFTIAAVALLPLLYLRRRSRGRRWSGSTNRVAFGVAAGGIGLALFAGYAFQTAGLHLTTPAKAGFITGLSVVIVPVLALWFGRSGQDAGRAMWLGVGAATAGLALLSLQEGLIIATGDLLVFCCAISFAVHILLTGRFSPRYDPVWLTFGQVVVVAVCSAIAALAFETRPALTGPVLFAAAFTGVLATSLAFGVQTVAQRFTNATHTALIFAAEPAFAALFSYLLIGELLGPRQLLGCGLILAGMLLAELRGQ